MIEVHDLVYEYPTKRALDGVSLRIQAGSITALVGPNGAGKSTLMRCIAALEMPYSGRVLIDGLDTRSAPRRIHERLAFLPDFFGLYDQLTVTRCLTYAGLAHGLRGAKLDRAVDIAAARVGLTDRMGDRASELSRGLRQRLAIGQAIVHEPRVVLLDEPAAGLDPDARRNLSRLFRSLSAEGMTLVVSSHILAELEDYCTDMVVIRDGKLAGGQSVSLSRPRFTYVIHLDAPAPGLHDSLQQIPGVSDPVTAGLETTISLDSPSRRNEIIRALIAAGYPVVGFREQRHTLEQAYLETSAEAAP
jgi:ABC-2 type transport system ATP-binding protein